eukprot:419159-Pyramimonas_sp.AAC.1
MSAVTWNARALLQHAGKHGARKLNYFLRLQPARSIVCLQDVRQDELQLREFLSPLGESVTLRPSFCGDSYADRIRGVLQFFFLSFVRQLENVCEVMRWLLCLVVNCTLPLNAVRLAWASL